MKILVPSVFALALAAWILAVYLLVHAGLI